MNAELQKVVDKIHDAANIVDVIGEFLTLKKAGVNYKGTCPFHDDHTPSFFVSPSKQCYKCFVCGEGGDVFTFLQKHEEMTFFEAVEWLCKKYNIDPPKREMSGEEQESYKNREAQRIAIKAAADFFRRNIAQAQTFLNQRGYETNDPILEKYGVGYAPAGNAALTELSRSGYSKDRLKEVDVVRASEDGREYDTFRDRVVFPFYDRRGYIIAFSGRLVTASDHLPKYLNTGETPLFSKGRHLFGLYQARQAISKKGFVYLVEGQFDVMTLARYGVENAIGGSGTAFTQDQVRLLQGLTDEVRLIYDTDKAGQAAAVKNCEILLQSGFVVKCVLLPKGKDPDEFARANKELTQKLLDDYTMTFPKAFRKMMIPRGCKDENVTARAINDICRLVACVKDAGLRLEYMKQMAKDFETKMTILESKIREARTKLNATDAETRPGLYGLDELKEHLEEDQPAILTSDMATFLDQYDDAPIVLCSGVVPDGDILKLRSIYSYFITADTGCDIDNETGLESPYLKTLAQMFRQGITEIKVVSGNVEESFITFYVRQTGRIIDGFRGDRDMLVKRCIELTSFAEDSVITINRGNYCSQLKLTRGQFDDLRRPYVQARKASMKVSLQSGGGLDDGEYFDPNDPPQYVKDNADYMNMWREYGFYPRLNKDGDPVCYMFRTKEGNGMVQVADFYMTPLLHIFNDDYDQNKRVLKVNRRHRKTPLYIEVVSKSLLKMSSIEEVLCNYDAVNFSNGEEWKWKKIKEYMSLHYTTCQEVKVYGNQQAEGSSRRPDEQFFAFANGIAHMEGSHMAFVPIDSMGVVTHNSQNYYLPAFSTIYAGQGRQSDKYEFISQLVYREVPVEKQISFEEWADLMGEVYKINHNGWWATIFAVMCAFRSNIHCIDRIFTAPFFIGPMSSGKTQIAVSIRSLFISPHQSIFNLNTGTDAAMQTYMSAFRDVPVVLDEYNNNDISNIKFQALKSIVYDGEEKLKRKGSSGKDFESDKVYTPVIVCGQEQPQRDDNSLMSRVIICEVPKPKDRTPEESAIFERLKMHEDPNRGGGLHNILMQILALRPAVMDHYRPLRQQAYEELKVGVVNSGERDRLMKTVSLFLGMVKLIEQYSKLKLPFTYEEFFKIAQEKIDWQLSLIRNTDKLGQFFKAVDTMINNHQVLPGRDYLIEQPGKVTGKNADGQSQTFVFEPGKKIMFFRLQSVFNEFSRLGYNTENTTFSTLDQNLRSHSSYVGTVPSRRFVWSEFVEEMNELLGKAVRVEQARSTNTSAVIIDYDAFMRAYGIDFRRNEAADEREIADTQTSASSQSEDNHTTQDPVDQELPF